MDKMSSAEQEMCQKSGNEDIDHPEPGSDCTIIGKTVAKVQLEAYRLPPGRQKLDETDYHDSRVIAPRTGRILEMETEPSYWHEKAQEELEVALQAENLNKNVAKNSIIFLGDGMGVASITAGRIRKGQMNNQLGEETKLAMDELPHAAFSKTYNIDYQVPDSAGTATAFLTGVKGRYSTIGVNGHVVYGDCSTVAGNEVRSVLKDAKLAGKSTGIISTTYLVHATPAGAYANTANRNWYYDGVLPADASVYGCKDIAHQFYDNLPLIDVALGGGKRYFRPDSTTVDEIDEGTTYYRKDGQDFVEMWLASTELTGEKAKYVISKEELDAVDPNDVDHLWGMFAPGSMDYEVERDATVQPSIEEMTRKAIEILQKNENGFYLLVEGARIDHGHHSSIAHKALGDLVALDNAVAAAREMTSEDDTLLVVTADHSHTFNMGEYALRGNPILGLAPSDDEPERALDGKNFTAVMYGNGPGYMGSNVDYENIVREDVTSEMAGGVHYVQQSAVPRSSESHAGEDVAILASGPMAHLFHGVHEQNYIAHAMRYAACIGDNKDHCLYRQEQEALEKETTTMYKPIPDQAVAADDSVEFLGDLLSPAEATAILNAFFSLEIILTFFIICLLGITIKTKKV